MEIGGREVARASRRVQEGEEISCTPLPIEQEGRVEPQPGDLRILHEDDDLVVLDKKAGMVVHPGAGQLDGTIANHLLDRYPEMAGVGGSGRPGIVHRLDRGTTGILVTARSTQSYLFLSEAFAARRVTKRYLAIVFGSPDPPVARIEAAIGRDPRDRKKMAVRRDGRPAETSYRVIASGRGTSLVEIDLGTGRTHQIRVHLKACHHPLVGDPVYGEARWKELDRHRRKPARSFPRPALHAWRLAFPHPRDEQPWRGEAPVPADLIELWTRLTATPFPELPELEDWPRKDLSIRVLNRSRMRE